jgi:SWIM/SEC-C metal-binding protein
MARLGTKANPLMLSVQNENRAAYLMEMCSAQGWQVIVRIAENQPEDLDDLEQKLNPDTVEYNGPKIGRNDPCPCGSGKKYKKCCLTEQETQHQSELELNTPDLTSLG